MDGYDRSIDIDGRTAFQLTWAPPTPADPSEPQKFSFAPNVTPVTFTAPSPADDDDSVPSQSTLFPDPDPSSSSLLTTPSSPIYQPAPKRRRKTASTAPKDTEDDGSVAPEHIPRPPNAFILFRSSFIKSQHVSSSIEGNHGTLSKIVGMVWHNLSFEERQIWQAKAKRALAEHKRRFPEYSFRPSNKDKAIKAVGVNGEVARARDGSAPPSTTMTTGATTVPAKRKQRECGPRDEARCEHIAALVAKGLKGQSLEDAVKHFDATRAPAVITPRFEQPITALQFEGGSVKVQVKDEPKEEKIAVQRQQQQQAQVKQQPLPLHRFRRGSSAPLLDSETTETAARRQSFLLQRSASPLQPSPIRPGAAFLPMPTLSLPSMPSLRAHRKRSASSSPPHRPRMLLPAASLPSIPTAYLQSGDPHAPLSLSLSTTMSSAEMSSYAASAPLSAPALSRQPTLVLDQTQTQASDYYDYDGSQGIWYDGASGSSPNTAAGSEYGYPSAQSWEHPSFVSSITISPQAHATKLKTTLQDFSQFSFTSSNTPAPASASAPMDHSQPESYSPFDTTPGASSSTAVEDYSGMPMLVEPPPLPHPHPQPQQHPLHIQTNWAQADFDYARSGHGNEGAYYPPPPTSASTLDSASVCDSPVKLSHSSYPHTMAYGGMPDLSAYGATPAPAPPTSPSSDCTAPHSAHTPRESSSEPSVYDAYNTQPHQQHQQHQHEGYASFDDGMGVGVNVNVSIDMDPALFQTFYEHSKLSGLAGFGYHAHPDAYLSGMAQSQVQVQHAL